MIKKYWKAALVIAVLSLVMFAVARMTNSTANQTSNSSAYLPKVTPALFVDATPPQLRETINIQVELQDALLAVEASKEQVCKMLDQSSRIGPAYVCRPLRSERLCKIWIGKKPNFCSEK